MAKQSKGCETGPGRGGIALEAERLAGLGFARALLTIGDIYAAVEEPVEKPLRAAVRRAQGYRTILVATSRLSLREDVALIVVI